MARYGRKDYEDVFDPFHIVPTDEPVFLLRAQDLCAADCVRFWADLNDKRGGDPRVSRAARAHASAMDAWPVKKIADFKVSRDTPDNPDHSQKLRTIDCRDSSWHVEVRDNGDLMIHMGDFGCARTHVRELQTIITRANLLLENHADNEDRES